MKRDPYPLQWPDGWKRATSRYVPKFGSQFARDRDAIIRQLKMRNASRIVITSDLPLRSDGIPYANASCNDPGIAVWWVERSKEQVMACDRWRLIGQNARAISMTLEALRGIERWGSSQMVERAFAGFAALPPGSSGTMPSGPRPWRDVLGGAWPALQRWELLAIAKARHRAAIQTAHPDAGGSHELAAELNAAIAAAEVELS